MTRVKTVVARPYHNLVISHRKDDVADLAVIKEMFVDNVYDMQGYKMEQDRPVILDIGANIGTFTLLCLSIAQENNRAITVYAVEPEEHNLAFLKKNLAQNSHLFEGGSEVIIVEKGISDFNGRASITDESGGSRVGQIDGENQVIDIISFDAFIEQNGIEKVDFTKIDIEGSEVPLIDGASKENLLKSHFYAIEFDRFNEVDGFLKTMSPFMYDFSFRTWGIPANGCNVYFENHHWSES